MAINKTKNVKNKKKKIVKQVPRAVAHILASYNNTIITITDPNGNALGWASAGMSGFKGPKKATPYAASMVVKNLAEKIVDYGVKEVSILVKGIGAGREGAIRASIPIGSMDYLLMVFLLFLTTDVALQSHVAFNFLKYFKI